MKAAYYRGQGRFQVTERQEPALAAKEVRLKVAYCGICGTDLHIYHGNMDARVGAERITGHECSAEIVELGEGVLGFELGQRVAVRPLLSCGDCPACNTGHGHICQNLQFMGVDTEGAFQQYWVVPAALLHRIPPHVSLKCAALAEPLAVACHDVRLGKVQAGDTVVVLGAGPIGMLVAMVARTKGANVLIAEIDNYRLELARKLGFTSLHPAEEDPEAYVNERTGGAGADVVFEVTGTQEGALLMSKLAKVRGRIVVVAIYAFKPQIDIFQFFWRELQLCGARVYEAEDFDESIRLIADGLPVADLISKISPLSDLQSIFDGLETDHKAMKTLVDCQQ